MAVVAVVVGAYIVTHLDDEIRHEVERLLAEHYEHLDVRVDEARLIEGKGIEVRRVSFRRRDAAAAGPPLLEIEEVFLACPVQIRELLQGLPPINRIVLHRPHLRATRLQDDSWDASDLLPLPSAGKSKAEVVVRKGIVEFAHDSPGPSTRVMFREVNGAIRPAKGKGTGDKRQETGEAGDLAFTVSAVSPFCKTLQLTGRLGKSGDVRVRGRLGDLAIAGRDLAMLPESFGSAAALQELRGTIEITSAEYRPPAAGRQSPQWTARLACEEVAINHAALPDPITGLTGELVAGNGGIESPKLAGECGGAPFVFSLRRNGWRERAPFSLAGRIENLRLAARHWRMLPGAIRDVWERFRPEGVVDIDLHEVSFDGARVLPNLTVTCRDASLVADKIPYRLVGVRGNVQLRPAANFPGGLLQLDVQLEGEAVGRRQVTIAAAYTLTAPLTRQTPEVYPVGSIRVTGNRILVEETLISAMPEGPQRFLNELRPQGEFDFVWQATRSDPNVFAPHKQLEITLQGGAVSHVKFPYALQNVRGKVYAADGDWRFANVTATAGGGTVTCNGSLSSLLAPREEGQNSASLLAPREEGHGAVRLAERDGYHPTLSLRFIGKQLALDASLYAALPDHARRSWDALEPSGNVDVTVDYTQQLGGGQPQVEQWIVPHGNTVSVRPRFFPYRIDQLQGRVHVVGSDVRFHEISGRHGQTQVVTGGTFQTSGAGGWSLELSELSVDRLIFDKELVTALPPALSQIVSRLNPRGQISVDRSSVRLSRSLPSGPVESAWQLHFDFHQAALDCGVPLENVSGGVSLAGHARGGEFSTEGEIAVDMVHWNKFFFHDVRGPLFADASKVVFGQNATPRGTGQPRQITANAYGGRVAGDGVVTLGPRAQFAISASYQGGDLRRLVTETWATESDVKGIIYGRLNVQGIGQSPETITGDGVIALNQAELYQLPQLIRLFKLLRRREPDKTAFTGAHAEFDISGRNVMFDKLNLSGDALTFYGQGSVVFDRYEQRLNLAFDTDLAPPNAPLPGLRSIMRQASSQFMRTHVQGTVQEPVFSTEPLPALSEALQQLQQELEPRAAQPGQTRGASGFWGRLFR